MTYRTGLAALEPAAQVAWIDKHVSELHRLLKEAAYLLEDGLKTDADLSQSEWDERAEALVDAVNERA